MEIQLLKGFEILDTIVDFNINIDTKQDVKIEGSNTILIDQMSAKNYLQLLIQTLIDDSNSKSKSHFLTTLFNKRNYWRKKQYEVVTKLNVIDKGEVDKHLSFFNAIQRIIELAEIEFNDLMTLGSDKTNKTSIKKFSDILEDKYKNKEDDIFSVLGKSFPEFYNENGKALNNKKGIKAILNSWYKLLFEFNIISLNPTKPQKEQICKVLLERCKFSDMSLSSKTLFDNDGIEVNPLFKKEYIELKNAIKSLNIK